MPYNGSGDYVAPSNSWNPAVGGTTVDSADWNSTQQDYETALSNVICRDGQSSITANLPNSGFKWTGVNPNSGSTSRTEYASGATLQDGAPLDAGYTGGTTTAYTVTLTPAIAAYADKQCFRVIFNAATGATPTINFNAVGAKKIYQSVGGAAVQITTNDIPANYPAILRYDSTLDTAAGAFWLINRPVPVIPSTTITTYTSGSGTYTVPAGCVRLLVRMVGGGGGGGGSGTGGGTGVTGGNTTFGTLTAGGGVGAVGQAGGNPGAGGTGTNGDINIGGENGSYGNSTTVNTVGAVGGGSAFLGGRGSGGGVGVVGGTAITNSGGGGGGGGGGGSVGSASGGGGGGSVSKIISAPSASYSYAVGAGGTAGTAGTAGVAGGAGAAGIIIIEEYYV